MNIFIYTMPSDKELLQLSYAKRYYDDAPEECWRNEEILKIVYTGGWGRCTGNPLGGLIGLNFNRYTFKYKGYPLFVAVGDAQFGEL